MKLVWNSKNINDEKNETQINDPRLPDRIS